MGKRLRVLLLTVLLTVSMLPSSACAAEYQNLQLIQRPHDMSGVTDIRRGMNNFVGNPNVRAPLITAAELTTGKTDEGLYIAVTTSTNVTATEIGVVDLQVQRKKFFGWKTMETTSGSTTNSDMYVADMTYKDIEAGDEFRVLCTHFADFSDGRHTVENVSETITF